MRNICDHSFIFAEEAPFKTVVKTCDGDGDAEDRRRLRLAPKGNAAGDE